MKKIGILTFHSAINYGAVLQAYALQQALKIALPNDDVKIIDFKTERHIKAYDVFKRKHSNFIKNIILQILTFWGNILLLVRKRRFHAFVKEELILTERYITEEELLNKPPKMDVFITGSDQVFNPNGAYPKAYYLGFNKISAIKVAYAPSFGISDFSNETRQKVKGYLLDFDALSCRENVGADFISSIVNYDVPNLLDPVFLLDKKQWGEIAIKPKTSNSYIFVYDLNGGKSLITIAKKIAKKTGLKIICQTQRAFSFYNIDRKLFSSGPKEYLGLIQNADYVVTDSFHGTAFSIVFEKPFFSYIAFEKKASRIRSIVNSLNLNHRIIENGEVDNFEFTIELKNEINFNLGTMINESKIYLKKSICNGK